MKRYAKPIKEKTDAELLENLDKNVFQKEPFGKHVDRVGENLNVHPEVVRTVLQHYFGWLTVALNTVSRFNRRIAVYGFFYFAARSGKRHKNPKQ